METIYLGTEEEITSALDKIRQTPGQSLLLVIPKGSLILQSLVNLELLRRQTEILNKNISLFTDDELGARLAKRVGINVQRKSLENLTPAASVKPAGGDSFSMPVVKPAKPTSGGFLATDNKMGASVKKPNYPARRVALADIVSQRQLKRLEKPKTDFYHRKPPEKSFYFGSYTVDPKKIRPQKIEEKLTLTKHYPLKRESRISSRMTRVVLLFSFLGVAVLLLTALSVLPRASLALKLKTKPFRQSFEMIAAVSPENNQTVLEALPASLEKVTKQEKKIFKTTGLKSIDSKAQGGVTLFNKRGVSQKLVASTRLINDSGQIFRLNNEVIVPTASVAAGGEIQAGQIKVQVSADKAGPEGNIGPTSFKIAAFVEQKSELASMIYGQSFEPISGGASKNTPFISQADFDQAKTEMSGNLKELVYEEIKAGLSTGQTLLPDGLEVNVLEINSDKPVGAEAENFEVTIKAEVVALIFKEEDVLKASLEAIKLAAGENQKIKDESLSGLNYKIKSINLAGGQIIFEATIEKELVENIDVNNLKANLVGKNEQEATQYLSGLDGVASGELTLWPFWVKKIPKTTEKIKITIK